MRKAKPTGAQKALWMIIVFCLVTGNMILLFLVIGGYIFVKRKEIIEFLESKGVKVDESLKNAAYSTYAPKVNVTKVEIPKVNFSKYFSFSLPSMKINKTVILLIFLAIFGILFIRSSYVVVNAGTIGVLTRFGRVTEDIFGPGLHFKVPFVDSVLVYNTKKIIYETSDTPGDSDADYVDYAVDTTTKDGQQIQVRYSVRFSVNQDKVTWIANNLGNEQEIVEKIVKTDSRIHTRNTPKQYPASDLYTGNIEEVQEKVAEKLAPVFEENGLILDEFGIRSISFTADYVDAIESKQIEAEKIATQQNIAEQEKYKKQAAITKAEGEAESQRLQQQTLNDSLLQKMWIEKWDGKLPTYQGSSTPLIQLP